MLQAPRRRGATLGASTARSGGPGTPTGTSTAPYPRPQSQRDSLGPLPPSRDASDRTTTTPRASPDGPSGESVSAGCAARARHQTHLWVRKMDKRWFKGAEKRAAEPVHGWFISHCPCGRAADLPHPQESSRGQATHRERDRVARPWRGGEGEGPGARGHTRVTVHPATHQMDLEKQKGKKNPEWLRHFVKDLWRL